MFYTELPKAIIEGIKAGLGDIMKLSLGNIGLPSVNEISEKLSLAWKSSTKTLTGEASKIFAIMDLSQASSGQDMATKIGESVENGFKRGSIWWQQKFNEALAKLKEIWLWLMKEATKIWDGIVSLWRTLWNTVTALLSALWSTIESIWNGVINALTFLWSAIELIWKSAISALMGLWDSLQTIWTGVINSLTGLWNFIQSIWTGAINGLTIVFNSLSGIVEIFKSAFNSFITGLTAIFETLKTTIAFIGGLGSSIVDGIKSGIVGLGNFFTDLGSNIFSGLKSGLDGLSRFFTDLFNNLNPASLLEKVFKIDGKGQGLVERTLGIDVPGLNFARGGIVPGRAMISGDSALNDRVLALVSPGEAVIPRSLMENTEVKSIVKAILDGKIAPPTYAKGSLSISAKGGIQIGGNKIPGTAITDIPTLNEVKDQIIDQISPFVDIWEIVRKETMKMVWSLFENTKFHSGGLVPSFAAGGEVPALLNPGEYVINSAAARNIGLSRLNAMNSQNQVSGPTNQTINVSIDLTATQLDDAFVRTKLVPRIKDEIRRASLDGSFVVSGKGIRK
jgi:hypothetical protein